MALLLLPLNMPQHRLLEWGVPESVSVIFKIHVLILPPGGVDTPFCLLCSAS